MWWRLYEATTRPTKGENLRAQNYCYRKILFCVVKKLMDQKLGQEALYLQTTCLAGHVS